ncbi:site-specific integrase [Campylobacter canadensis]|uniref:tyrosine-type recombinase/integrase n=1 Tax=Campylobacter canadensis TaxID=449520 RepID=UPI001554748F|nr:site-specific integrase [Campylobacter canadensis]MBZ7995144.1 site-specific integrase [Campylobacter canadensis]MBZ7997160.1 site-specific integrase [Campylobacter canadensis]MBZ8000856.1 site-specific integrase [Campylobacter canadensis]MBZ8003820.1 site-specific integrase [Campylobacter canadensis]
MKIVSRNNKLYIHYINNENKLIRFSTKLSANKSNLTYVKANIFKLIKDYELDLKLSKESFEGYALKFLKHNEVGKKDITNKNNKRIFKNHISPYFKTLKDLNYKNVQSFISKLNENNSLCAEFKKDIANRLKALCTEAIESESIKTFAFPKTNFKDNKVKLNISDKVLTIEELRNLIESCKDDFLKQVIIIKCFTGIRNSELIALTWDCIDYENEKITIKYNISDGKITTTKTNRVRVIDMLPQVKTALQEIENNHKHNDTYVLSSAKNKTRYTNSSALVKRFKDYLKANDFKELKFYWTRHIFATLCLSKNIPIDWISSTLGHHKINTTLTYYATYIEDKEKIDAIKNEFKTIC